MRLCYLLYVRYSASWFMFELLLTYDGRRRAIVGTAIFISVFHYSRFKLAGEFCLLQASHRSLCCVAFQFILHLEPSEHVNWYRHSHLPVDFHFWSSPRKLLDNFNSESKQHFLLIGLVSRKQWWKTKNKVLATFSFVGITVPFMCFSRSPSVSAVWVEIIVHVHECTDIVVQVGTAEERLSYTLPTSPLPFSFFPPLRPDNIPFCSLLQFHQFHKNAVKLQPQMSYYIILMLALFSHCGFRSF